MFTEAYEKFEQRLYSECINIFKDLGKNDEDCRVRYWSKIFHGRCLDAMNEGFSGTIYLSAHDEMPGRAEAMYEVGRKLHEIGDLYQAEQWLQKAKNADKNVICIRYEGDKYFEKPQELLINIYMRWSRYNDAEELCYTLINCGNPNFYDTDKAKYNHLFTRHYSNSALEYVKVKSINAGKRLVIQMPSGYDGLGDQLVFSHIPRIAKQTGRYEKVYVSTLSKYGRPEYKDLVWGLNPWVDGFVEEEGTFTQHIQFGRILEKWVNLSPKINLMDSIMILHDLDDGKRGHVPECYYEKKERSDLEWVKGKTILDVGSRTISTKDFNKTLFLKELQSQGCVPDLYIVAPGLTNSMSVDEGESITPKDIYEWCDIIMNCGNYVCFNSGGYWLSAALGVKGSHIWIKEKNLPAWSYLWHKNIHVNLATICQ